MTVLDIQPLAVCSVLKCITDDTTDILQTSTSQSCQPQAATDDSAGAGI